MVWCHYRPQKTIRRLGQGNVFTRVCHSVHRGGWLPSMHHRSHDQHGGLPTVGSACREGVGQTPPPN